MSNNTYINRRKELELRCAAIENGVKVLNQSIALAMEVVKKEDGKTLNRRLTNKIQELINAAWLDERKVFVSMSYDNSNYNEISFYLSADRSYHVDGLMGGHAEYIDSELYTHIRFPKEDKINANAICEDAQRTMLSNAKVDYKYHDAVQNFDMYKEKYENALLVFKRTCGEINPLFYETQVFIYDSKLRGWDEERDNKMSNR